ncbi:MAG: type II and III secretion system protein [Planctomycetes bacterium]|nr:type II and III secretion system protein [Planctomycetota bacterium]
MYRSSIGPPTGGAIPTPPRLALLILVLATLALAPPTQAHAQATASPPPFPPPAPPPAQAPAQPAAQPPAPPAAAAPDAAEPNRVYRKGRVEIGDMVTLFYRVDHDRGKHFRPFLERFLTPGKGVILESEPLHLLSITDTKSNIGLVEGVLKALDVPDPQVMIEATIYEKTIDNDLEIGVEGSLELAHSIMRQYTQVFNPEAFLRSSGAAPFQGSTVRLFASGDTAGTVDVRLRQLLDKQKAKILSNPRILVAAGHPAKIVAGDKVPIPNLTFAGTQPLVGFNLQDVNIQLEVTPHVIGTDFVHLDIKPEVSTVVRFEDVANVGPVPIISTRRADTDVTIRSGDQVVIGGLVREIETEADRGLPVLSEVPIIGYFFKRHQETKARSEIIFYLRPIIVTEKGDYPPRIIEPGR